MLTALFTPDDANYASATIEVPLTVLTVAPIITWLPPAPIVYGEALSEIQLNATVSLP